MPRYYFHVCRKVRIMDQVGLELGDVEAATAEGFATARELAVEAVRDGRSLDVDRIEIEDAEGNLIQTVPVHGNLC